MKIFSKEQILIENFGKIMVSDKCNTEFGTMITYIKPNIIIIKFEYQCSSFQGQKLLFSHKEKIKLDVELEGEIKDNNDLFTMLNKSVNKIFVELGLTNKKDISLLNTVIQNLEEQRKRLLLINENLNR